MSPERQSNQTSVRSSPSRIESFRYAFEGWWYMLRTQPNTWIHGTISVVVLIVARWLRLPPGDWALLVFAMGLVWALEFVNTAVEAAVDLASAEIHPLAKISKDVMAGAVLTGAGTAALVGLLVLGPPLLARLRELFG